MSLLSNVILVDSNSISFVWSAPILMFWYDVLYCTGNIFWFTQLSVCGYLLQLYISLSFFALSKYQFLVVQLM